jgi:hypothetical protein
MLVQFLRGYPGDWPVFARHLRKWGPAVRLKAAAQARRLTSLPAFGQRPNLGHYRILRRELLQDLTAVRSIFGGIAEETPRNRNGSIEHKSRKRCSS